MNYSSIVQMHESG
jgi:hypothetical protein